MATNKTINPTNQTVSIPAFTDQPDARVFSNDIDKSIDGINTNYTKIGNAQSAIAIVATGNTHPAIASGQFVYVRDHGTLAEGLYIATDAIAANATLSTTNLSAQSSGGLNALFDQISELLNAVRQKSYSIPTTGKTILFSGASNGFVYIQVANSANQFGLYLYYGSSANCYVREIVGSSYITVAATTGGLVFTNTSSSARTIRLVAINGYDNLPDS